MEEIWFVARGSVGKVELANSSRYASSTKVGQTLPLPERHRVRLPSSLPCSPLAFPTAQPGSKMTQSTCRPKTTEENHLPVIRPPRLSHSSSSFAHRAESENQPASVSDCPEIFQAHCTSGRLVERLAHSIIVIGL